MMNRRLLLIGAGAGAVVTGLGIGRAVSGAAVAASADRTSPADPGMADMSGMAGPTPNGPGSRRDVFSYRGHAVEFIDAAGSAMVTIDGRKRVHVERMDTGRYHTHLLPFTPYADPRILARDVIEAAAQDMIIL